MKLQIKPLSDKIGDSIPLPYYATAGEVVDGLFTAPQQGGLVTVTAAYEGFSAQRDILVVDAPSSMALRMSSPLCRRPMAARTLSSMDWGLTLIRSTSFFRRTASFSAVMVSGLPASTVSSTASARSNPSRSLPSRRSICSAVKVVGVPPPI